MTGVEAWLREVPGFADASVRSTLPSEGYSNTSVRLLLDDAPMASVLLRQQPAHGIFEPYDVLREGRVLAALAPTPIPVPAVLATEPTDAPFGAPAILLEWIDAPHLGEVPPDEFGTGLGLFFAMVEMIHDLDWQAAGLDFLGVPDDPVAGFQAEVELVARRMAAFEADDEPLLRSGLDALRALAPTDGTLALCHGDINVFNYLYRDGAIVGVVDWEQARISDPRSDRGQLDALSLLKGMPWSPAGEMAPFRAFWLFQLAVIHRGLGRYTDIDPWYTWAEVTEQLARALDEL